MDRGVCLPAPHLVARLVLSDAWRERHVLPALAVAAGAAASGPRVAGGRRAIAAGLPGMAVHAFLQGAAFSPGAQAEGAAVFAVVVGLHRLIVGSALRRLLRPRHGRLAVSLAVLVLCGTTLAGHVAGPEILGRRTAESTCSSAKHSSRAPCFTSSSTKAGGTMRTTTSTERTTTGRRAEAGARVGLALLVAVCGQRLRRPVSRRRSGTRLGARLQRDGRPRSGPRCPAGAPCRTGSCPLTRPSLQPRPAMAMHATDPVAGTPASPGPGASDGAPALLRAPAAALAVAAVSLATGAADVAAHAARQRAEASNGDANAGAETRKAVVAARTATPPVVDGMPSESVWQAAAPLAGFVQREPADGQPASEPTELRVLFDDEALYMAVWAYDSQADAIVPGESIRDYEITDADAVLMVFDTYDDQQNGFVFGTTPTGIEYDGQVAAQGGGGGFFLGGGGNAQRRFQAGAGGGFNKNWDGSWDVAVSRDDEGWYAEFRIPFSTLRYGSATDAWGFNVSRRVRRLNEEALWSPVPREFGLYRLDFAGRLAGLEPPFRRAATITPYVLGSTFRDYEDPAQTSFVRDAEFGGESKVQITQGLTLDATVNTDFAQVEVDDQQVNLTRFSLLFPEKRPFFLENAGFFTVGAGGADLFFSRRIGISDGRPVPIRAGGRLSGRAAGLNVGMLHIRTEAPAAGEAANHYSVARVAKELPNRSRLGGIFVNRASNLDGDYNRTYAVDGRLGIGDQLTLASFVARTETPGLTGADMAWDFSGGWASREWRANVTVREIGERFNPEVGFLPRDGHRYYQAFGMWYWRPSRILREVRPHVSYYTYRSVREGVERGFNESSRWHIDSHWEWPSGMELHTGANYVAEGLHEPFEISDGVLVPAGTYAGWESQIVFFTDQSRTLSLNSRFNWGSFLSGARRSSSGDVTIRGGARSSATFRLVYNDVRLPEGDFTATLASVNLGYFFTPRVYWQSLIQYSDQAGRWSANMRFGWLNTAGTGLFVVYNDVRGLGDLTGPLGRSVFVKFTRQVNVLGG